MAGQLHVPTPRPNYDHAGEEMTKWVIPNKVRVSIGWIGEGISGEFNEDDPGDAPLLRFDAYDLAHPDENDWDCRSRQDASYCTCLPAWLPVSVLTAVCRAIAESIADESHWKRLLEEWSWADEDDAKAIAATTPPNPS